MHHMYAFKSICFRGQPLYNAFKNKSAKNTNIKNTSFLILVLQSIQLLLYRLSHHVCYLFNMSRYGLQHKIFIFDTKFHIFNHPQHLSTNHFILSVRKFQHILRTLVNNFMYVSQLTPLTHPPFSI